MLRVKRAIVLPCLIAVTTVTVSRARGEPPSDSSPGAPIPSPTSPDDECPLGEVLPLLTDSPGNQVERIRKGPRELVERTRLARGVTVEVAQGGCAHYGVRMSFTAERRTGVGRRPSDRLLADALEMLRALRPRTRSPVVTDTIAVLTAHEHDRYADGDVLQGRAYPDVTISVSARGVQDGRDVEVIYSFAL